MSTLKAMPEKVIVSNMMKGERIINGIILLNDDGKDHGIRARWAQIVSAGSRAYGLKDGQWVLIPHGRWTRVFKMDLDGAGLVDYYEVDKDSLLMVSDSEPLDDEVKESFVQGS